MSPALRRCLLGAIVATVVYAATARADTSAPVDLFAPVRAQVRRITAPAAAGEPSAVIYPDQRLPLRFSHRGHLGRDIPCQSCHPAATTSTSTRDNLLPTEAACAVCHAIDRGQPYKKTDGPPAACASCHVGLPREPEPGAPPQPLADRVARLDVPPAYLKFNHALHAAQKIPCATCHGDLAQVDLATRAQLPKMATCLGCHDDGLRSGRTGDLSSDGGGRRALRTASPRCGTCHLTASDGTLQQHLPSGRLIPSGSLRGDDHGAEWKRLHRAPAQNDPDYCASCHGRGFCFSCHNSVTKPLDIHGGDYVGRHSLDARRNQPDCSACHRRQTFCLGCHERMGVISHSTLPGTPAVSAFSPASPRRFHPEGWASPIAGPSHHSVEAQRNLRACASCHREQTCLDCHSTLPGGRYSVGRSPHPGDWVSSGRCRALGSRNLRVCLKCHRSDSPALGCD